MALSTTKIEYGQFNWQIYRGCLNKPEGFCPVPRCWMERVAARQGWDFHAPEFLRDHLLDPIRRQKPARLLVNFAGDLFGDWVDPKLVVPGVWMLDVISTGQKATIKAGWLALLGHLNKEAR